MVTWAHPCQHPKRYLDRFSRFCRDYERVQQSDRQTERPRYSVCSNRPLRYMRMMRCSLQQQPGLHLHVTSRHSTSRFIENLKICCTTNCRINPQPIELEEDSTHKSATTHACNCFFVHRDLDLWPLIPKSMGFQDVWWTMSMSSLWCAHTWTVLKFSCWFRFRFCFCVFV